MWSMALMTVFVIAIVVLIWVTRKHISATTVTTPPWFLALMALVAIVLIALSLLVDDGFEQIEPKVLAFAQNSKQVIDCIGVPHTIKPKRFAPTSSRVGEGWGSFSSTYVLTGTSGTTDIAVELSKQYQEWHVTNARVLCSNSAPRQPVKSQ